MRSQERKGLSGSLQVKRSKVFGGERKMLNPLICITSDRISIASFLTLGTLRKHSLSLNQSSFFENSADICFPPRRSWELGRAFEIDCFTGFSSTMLRKKKLRFKMVQGHRGAGGRVGICNHLTPAPLMFPSALVVLGTCCALPPAFQSVLLHQGLQKAAFLSGQNKVSGKPLAWKQVVAWGGGLFENKQLCDIGQDTSPLWSSFSIKLGLEQSRPIVWSSTALLFQMKL